MKHTLRIVLTLAALASLSGCFLAGWGGNSIPEETAAPQNPEDVLYARVPQILNLEHKLDIASTSYFFGEYDVSEKTARGLLIDIADLRLLMPDPDVCDHLDYLETRTRCLLQRMSDEKLQCDSQCSLLAAVDSISRNTVVEDEIEVEMNSKTKHWISYFQGSGRRHFAKWLDRSGEMRAVIEPILVEVGVPRDLLYLSIIESGLNLDARSYMRAIGPWQFMAGTAKLFGLRINWWIDERKDIIASTYAAANYMKYLYDLFGSWPLALAAYNSGEHRVAYAMMHQQTNDYWRLRLPMQTSWFVPKFMAALAIGRDPAGFGFSAPPDAPLTFDLIEVKRPTELGAIASAAGCSVSDIKDLNPHLKKWATPPDMVVEVKVPKGTGDQCLARLAKEPDAKPVKWLQHRIVKGESLVKIAASYEISVEELKRINEIKSARLLHAGNILLIPVKDNVRSARIPDRPTYRTPPPLSGDIVVPKVGAAAGSDRKITYVVKTDDSLVKIASRFNVGLGSIREWNQLDYSATVHPGDSLVIYVPREFADDELGEGASDQASDAGSAAYVVHIVKKGETLTSISKRYKKSVTEILGWNQRLSRNRIRPGDAIKIWREPN